LPPPVSEGQLEAAAHGIVPPLPARRCLWAAVTLFEGHTEMEHQSENLDFQKQSCGLIYCLLGSAFFYVLMLQASEERNPL